MPIGRPYPVGQLRGVFRMCCLNVQQAIVVMVAETPPSLQPQPHPFSASQVLKDLRSAAAWCGPAERKKQILAVELATC